MIEKLFQIIIKNEPAAPDIKAEPIPTDSEYTDSSSESNSDSE